MSSQSLGGLLAQDVEHQAAISSGILSGKNTREVSARIPTPLVSQPEARYRNTKRERPQPLPPPFQLAWIKSRHIGLSWGRDRDLTSAHHLAQKIASFLAIEHSEPYAQSAEDKTCYRDNPAKEFHHHVEPPQLELPSPSWELPRVPRCWGLPWHLRKPLLNSPYHHAAWRLCEGWRDSSSNDNCRDADYDYCAKRKLMALPYPGATVAPKRASIV